MPLLLFLLAAAAVLVLSSAKTVIGYVRGVAVRLELAAIGGGLFLRRDAAAAFNRMKAAAAVQGVALVPSGPRAAFRTRADQASLLEERGALSAGGFAAELDHSPHQGGTAVDLDTAGGTNAAFRWLTKNAGTYGFKRTLAKEPWHWEYRP